MAYQPVGSSGTLIAAALESIGYYYQSYILDTFTQPFSTTVAYFLFVAVGMIAVIQFVAFGKAKNAYWLLVGPSVFFLILIPRTETFGSNWRFGRNDRNSTQVQNEVRNYFLGVDRADAGNNARVSSLFANYNRLVSDIVSSIVAGLTIARQNVDKSFIVRSELLGGLTGFSVEDMRLRELIHGGLFDSCKAMVDGAEQMDSPEVDPQKRTRRRDEFETARRTANVKLKPLAVEYVAGIRVEQPALANLAETSAETAPILAYLQANPQATETGTPWGAGSSPAQYTTAQILVRDTTFTCQQIWNYVFTGIYSFAYKIADRTLDAGERLGMMRTDLLADLSTGSGYFVRSPSAGGPANADASEQLNALVRVVSAYMLRNEMNRGSMGSFLQRFDTQGFRMQMLSGPGESDLSFQERYRLRANEKMERTTLMMTASSMPYYQGLMLYLLAILFPFFALLILIPGKFDGFLLWFMLWFWIKSWDIGLAVVMMLDDFLYILMGREENLRIAANNGKAIEPALNQTMMMMSKLDPSFQLTTYYSLIGAALSSVPIISSYLILGSLKGGAGLIAQGMSQMANPFSMAAFSAQGSHDILNLRTEALEERYSATERAFTNSMIGGSLTAGTGVDNPLLLESLQEGNIEGRVPPGGRTGQENLDLETKNAIAMGEMSAVQAGLGRAGSMLRNFPGAVQNLGPVGDAIMGVPRGMASVEWPRRNAERQLYEAMRVNDIGFARDSSAYNYFNSLRAMRFQALTIWSGGMNVSWTTDHPAGTELEGQIKRWGAEREISIAPARSAIAAIDGISTDPAAFGHVFGIMMSMNERSNAWSNWEFPFHVTEYSIISRFQDEHRAGRRDGLDLAAPEGTAVNAIQEGVVVFSGSLGEVGRTVIVQHKNGRKSLYSHLKKDSLNVKVGDFVSKATVLGAVGGAEEEGDQAHLHLEIIEGNPEDGYERVDPFHVISQAAGPVKREAVSPMSIMGKFFEELDRTQIDVYNRMGGGATP